MPLYEYRCVCGHEFEIVQPMTARVEDTVCPACKAKKATRLLSSFASKVVGTHKTGFAEMKAYDMLHERMDKFSKLPPIAGKRKPPTPPAAPSDTGSSGKEGTS